MKQRILYPLYLALIGCVAALCLIGCGLKSKPVLITGNVAIYEALAAIQDTADALREKNLISVEQRKELASKLLPALQTGQQLARLTKAWPADKPAPQELTVLIGQLRGLVQTVVEAWPPSAGRDALAAKLNLAQSAALALVTLFLR